MKKLLLSVSALLLLNVAAYAAEQIQSQTQNQYEHKNQYKSPPPLEGDESGRKNSYKSGVENGNTQVGTKANGVKKSDSSGMYKGKGGGKH
jgi:hypothetical protein